MAALLQGHKFWVVYIHGIALGSFEQIDTPHHRNITAPRPLDLLEDEVAVTETLQPPPPEYNPVTVATFKRYFTERHSFQSTIDISCTMSILGCPGMNCRCPVSRHQLVKATHHHADGFSNAGFKLNGQHRLWSCELNLVWCD